MIISLLKRLLYGSSHKYEKNNGNSGPSLQLEISSSYTSVPSMTVAEREAYLEKQRRDEAAKAWRKNPAAFRPIQELSTTAICPWCNQSLGNKKPPSRRSQFSCRNCGSVVYADPWHRIFPSCYLNTKQALIARYLGFLNKGAGTAGKSEDFWWAAQQKDWLREKTRLIDAEASDTLWTLMNYNVIAMKDILPLEEIDNIGCQMLLRR